MMCHAEGVKTTPRMSFHYDDDTNTAYFAEGAHKILEISADDVRRVANGTAGQLFLFPHDYKPFSLDLENLPDVGRCLAPAPDSLLAKTVFSGLAFDDSILSYAQKITLLMLYIVLLFLPGAQDEKIMLQILGPSGAGKTFFLNAVGRLVVGPTFKVIPLPEKTEEFENAIVNNSFLVFDNVTKISAAIRSRLCQVVSGAAIERRRLYSTFDHVRRNSKATVALTAITSPLYETEQANRALTLTCSEREDFIEPKVLLRAIDKQRDGLIAEILGHVRAVLRVLDAQRDYVPTVRMRLAGPASFIMKIARHEGWESEAKNLLDAWQQEQNSNALVGDDLADVITLWLERLKPEDRDRALSATELNKQLVQVAGMNSIDRLSWESRPVLLGHRLRRSASAYRKAFGMVIGRNGDVKSHTYKFQSPLPDSTARHPARAASDSPAGDLLAEPAAD